MMPRRFLVIALALLSLAVFGQSATAWDTKEFYHESDQEPGYQNWRSLWLCDPSVNIGRTTNCERNEHEWLTDRALSLAINGTNPWAIRSPTDLYVVDLNASFFRPDLVDGSDPNNFERSPSSWAGPLEERDLANPPHFAGVADFTYSIYDWINKNRLCPPHPRGNLTHCHNYSVWLGAGFNSSHFGSQAALSYRQLHQTALWAAGRAAQLRTALEQQDEATQAAFADNVREAELMALAYEGAAQHFLEDRWSTGHMWERWNAPDFRSNPYNNDIGQAAVIGAFTGIIHGSEAVLGQPLPLSSPLPSVGILGRDGVNPVEWQWAGSDENAYGVGDYRAEDMFDGRIGAGYGLYANTDWPLNVSTQRTAMMSCMAASFREVIEAFGTNANGGYGIDGVRIRDGAFNSNCLDTWATNWSIWKAWGALNASDTLTGTVVPYVVRTLLPSNAHIDPSEVDTNGIETAAQLFADYYGAPVSLTVDRASLARISSRIFWNGTFRPNGTDLARGGMGSFGHAQPGTYYGAPDYLEPLNLASLPATDPRGRDGNSIHGFFNRTFAGEICARSQASLFEQLRIEIRSARTSPEDRERARAVCQYLGQRIFAQTNADYSGGMRSYQVAPGTSAGARAPQQLAPVCAWQPTGAITSGPTDDTLPYYLHPGYVPFNGSSRAPNNEAWSDTFTSWGYAQQSIANWCDTTPVIDVIADDEERAREDIVAVVSDAGQRIELYGRNFGAGRGHVLIGQSWDDAIVVDDVVRWYDDRITFALNDQVEQIHFNDEDRAYVFVEKEVTESTASLPGRRTVGRFILQSDIPRPEIVSMRIFRGSEEFYSFERTEPPEDPGAHGTPPPNPDPGAFRPLTPGEIHVEIQFDSDIMTNDENTHFTLAGITIDGTWRGQRRWRGTFALPEGAEYAALRGRHPFSVNVRAREGGWIDGDPRNPGSEPDENNIVLVDTMPAHVERIEVRGGGRTVYRAQWTGGPDLDEVPNLTTPVMTDPERILRVDIARAAPAHGEGRLRLELSAPITEGTLAVQVGGATAELRQRGDDGTRWEGRFDYEEAQSGAIEGALPVRISGSDLADKGLDADPRSVAQIFPPGESSYLWARYEANRGDAASSHSGGTDTWHEIGEPPALSMVIILDASGSMGDNNRMANARDGIRQTLEGLPEDQSIELAGVVFTDCGSFQSTGFTRDLQRVRDFLTSASPSGGTPLADATTFARNLMASSANPGAENWRYVTFTDGQETCDGNVVAATQDFEKLLRDHRRTQEGRAPEEEDEDVARAPLPQVVCNPSSWRGYQVATEDNGTDLDDIKLYEHWYIERALPDGRCFARLETNMYYVHYGAIRDRAGVSARADWGINSRSSEETVDFGTSRLGAADLDRVRNAANALRGQTISLDTARGQIATAVDAALREGDGS